MGTSNDTTNEATEIVDINILPEVDTVPDGKKIMFIDSTDNSGGTIPFEKMRAQIADNATDPIARAQIANLAKLPEGSTTGDAELADIRVGANGKMYDTAGEAVRKQLQENKEQTDEAVASLKEDLGKVAEFKKGINLFNPDDKGITPNAQLISGAVKTNSDWPSLVTDFIPIDLNGSKTLRSTQAKNLIVAEYKSDETFIKQSTINSDTSCTLDDETTQIRLMYYPDMTTNLMIYQSDNKQDYEPYKEWAVVVAEFDTDTDDTLTKKGISADSFAVGKRFEDIDFEEIDVTNYMLLSHETYEGYYYENGKLITTTRSRNATSMVRLDKTKRLIVMTNGNADVIFFDENKKYISSTTSYCESAIEIDSYPTNAVYVAFSYWKGSVLGSEFWVRADGKVADYRCVPKTLKLKGERPVINIYTTDTEEKIYRKLCDAFFTKDCDVYWETGEYSFDEIWVIMKENYEIRNYFELPIGGNCRYFFQNSIITATQNAFNEKEYTGTVDLFSNYRQGGQSYELHDGTLIGNGICYVVHDEGSSSAGYYKHLCHNMTLKYTSDTQTNKLRKCVGGGTGLNGVSIFENCRFETDYQYDVSFHGITSTMKENAYFDLVVSNCYFSKRLSLDAIASNQTCNCYYSANSAQVTPTNGTRSWNVKSWCNETRTE